MSALDFGWAFNIGFGLTSGYYTVRVIRYIVLSLLENYEGRDK